MATNDISDKGSPSPPSDIGAFCPRDYANEVRVAPSEMHNKQADSRGLAANSSNSSSGSRLPRAQEPKPRKLEPRDDFELELSLRWGGRGEGGHVTDGLAVFVQWGQAPSSHTLPQCLPLTPSPPQYPLTPHPPTPPFPCPPLPLESTSSLMAAWGTAARLAGTHALRTMAGALSVSVCC